MKMEYLSDLPVRLLMSLDESTSFLIIITGIEKWLFGIHWKSVKAQSQFKNLSPT